MVQFGKSSASDLALRTAHVPCILYLRICYSDAVDMENVRQKALPLYKKGVILTHIRSVNICECDKFLNNK
jgi:hypothetical protein